MFPYIPCTDEDENTMLKTLGMTSLESLFSDIPEEIQLNRKLNLNSPKSEMEVLQELKDISSKNINLEELVCFLGAGAYDHYIPSVVKHITSRSEFYTAYTPYQPEISQGTLQVIFEYQTMISELTNMDVSNASLYDGSTACAEAARMAASTTKRKSIVVSKTVHPQIRNVLKTYMKFSGVEVIEIGFKDGVTDIGSLKDIVNSTTAAVIVQNPNFFGIVEDFTEIEKITHLNDSLLIMNVNPISLSVLKTPGEIGADIAVGEGQSLGNRLNFGGPYLGFMAVTKKLMRKMPGRIVGETLDLDGKRAFVLTLQTREQHIRRQRATSNICSDQGLNALAAAVYLITMGKEGLKQVAIQCIKKSHYALNELTKSGKYKQLFDKPFFNEFTITSNLDQVIINKSLIDKNILGGYVLEKDYSEIKNSQVLCVTEKRTIAEIDNLVSVMEDLA